MKIKIADYFYGKRSFLGYSLLLYAFLNVPASLFVMQKDIGAPLELLYDAENEPDLAKSISILLKFLTVSGKNITQFIAHDLDISKISLFDQYKNQFDKICNLETSLSRDEFLDSANFSELRNFKDMLNDIFNEVKEHLKDEQEFATINIDQVLSQIKSRVINFMLAVPFEQYKSKNCSIAIYKMIDILGLEILNLNFSVNEKEIVNLNSVLKKNNKIINDRLNNLIIELIYNYLKSLNHEQIRSLLDRLRKRGFNKQTLIHNLAQAIARYFRDDRAIISTEQVGNKESKKITDAIMNFINDDILKSEYKFNNYPKLIDEYLRSYKLMNLMEIPHYEQFINILLEEGVQINTRDFKGNSALIYAINNGRLSYIKLLMAYGADINLAAHDGITPLMKAVLNGDSKIIKLLLTYKPDLELKDIYGDNVVLLAEPNSAIEDLLKSIGQAVHELSKKLDALRELSVSLNLLALR